MKSPECCAAILSAIALLSGCSPYEKTTSVAFRDPSALRYLDEATGKSIPYSNGHDAAADTEIKRDDVRQGNRYSEMIVTGYEAADGSLVTKWRTDLAPTPRTAVFPNTGTITLPDHVAIDTSTDAARFPVCGELYSTGHGRFSRQPMTSAVIAMPCDYPHELDLTATTPWNNVESVHHISKNDRGRNIALAMMTTGLTAVAGATLLEAGEVSHHSWASVAGATTFAVGGAIDLAVLIPAIFSSDRDEVVYSAKR